MAFSSSPIRKHHALAIPLPAQGHLNPLMRFCKTLTSQGFTITFVNIDPIHHRIVELNEQQEQEKIKHEDEETTKQLDIRKAHVPIEGLDLRNDFRGSLQHFFEVQQGLAGGLEQLIEKLSQEDLPVTCLISDVLMTGPTQKVADKFNIPRIALVASSQSMQLLVNYLVEGQISVKDVLDVVVVKRERSKAEVFQEGLAGLPTTLRNGDLPDFKHVVNDNEYVYGYMVEVCRETNAKAHAIVVNSFEELESPAFESLSSHLTVPVYSVGPLVGHLENESSTSLWKEDAGCLRWLDLQPPLSVLYVSFGSITLLSNRQFNEILSGLLSSQQRFLWAFRPDLVESAPSSTTFPPDFLAKTNGRGHVVDWAPQLRVLSHPSIGGFLTHSGWNSTIESISNGVPMLCWPYFADQFMDAKYIVEEWKVGLRFEASAGEGGLVEKGEVERKARFLERMLYISETLAVKACYYQEALHTRTSKPSSNH